MKSQNDRERGATSTEYGVLVAFIALAIVVGVTAFGLELDAWYLRMEAALDAVF